MTLHEAYAVRGDGCNEDGIDTAERKRQINALLPINQLPWEILGGSFLICQAAQLKEFEGEDSHRWITISHVCCFWREVALEFARFWSDFTVTGAAFTNAMLFRSKQAPLNVKLYHSDQLAEPIQLVLSQLHRIQTLSFATTSHQSQRYIVENSAPLLRCLYYSREPMLRSDEEDDEDLLERRPQETPFDDVDMPALEVLRLIHSGLPWTSLLLKPTLTELIFRELYPVLQDDNSRLSDVLRALRRMPLLTEVNFCNVLPPFRADDSSAVHDPLSLPRLKSMELDSTASSAAYLLQNIKYPPTTHLHVRCSDTDEEAETLQGLFSALSSKMTGGDAASPAQPLSSVYLGDNMLCAWDTDPGAAVLRLVGDDEVDPAPRLLITMQHAHAPLNAFLQHLDAAVPLAGITTLYLEPPRRGAVDVQRWAAAAAGMAHLRTLGVGRYGFALLDALFARDMWAGRRTARDGARSMPVFPRLEVLLLRCVWMRPQPHAAVADSSVIDELHETLTARNEAGCRLKRIVLVSCVNVAPKYLEKLRRLVDEVEWDGKQYLATKGSHNFRRGDLDEQSDGSETYRVRVDAGTSDSDDDSDWVDDDEDVDDGEDEGDEVDEDDDTDAD